jgi:non-specific serine/threonine protein kinase
LLSREDQVVFGRLGVFAGGFTLDAAEAFVGKDVRTTSFEVESSFPSIPPTPSSPSVLESLASLVEKNLVRVVGHGEGGPRLRMLETVREYALMQLEESEGLAAARDRHLAHYLALAPRAETELIGPDQGAWLDRLEADHDNLRAALGWAAGLEDSESELDLVTALWRYWIARGHLREGLERIEAALARTRTDDSLLLGRAFEGAGTLALWLREYERAIHWFERALEVARAAGDRDRAAAQLAFLGMVAHARGDHTRARSLAEEALAEARRAGARWATAMSLRNLMLFALGTTPDPRERPQLRAETEEAVAILRDLGDHRNLAVVLAGHARILADGGESGAIERLREGLGIARRVGDQFATVFASWQAAIILADSVAPEPAARLLGIVEASQARTEAIGSYDVVGTFNTAHGRTILEHIAQRARAGLGEEGFTAAVAAGRAVPFDQTAEEVLAIVPATDVPTPSPKETREEAPVADDALSPREREVLLLVAEGRSNKRIAEDLFIAPTTAKFHVTSLLNKLGADTRAQLVAVAAHQGML